jgi:hypothetical protein
MSEQPEALMHADWLESLAKLPPVVEDSKLLKIAMEIRRLHEENERLRGIVPEVLEQLNDELCEENKELLGALKLARRICNNLIGHPDDEYGKLIDAAIAKAEGTE